MYPHYLVPKISTLFLDPGLSLLGVVVVPAVMGDPEVRAHPEEGAGAPQDHPCQTGDDTSDQGRQTFIFYSPAYVHAKLAAGFTFLL